MICFDKLLLVCENMLCTTNHILYYRNIKQQTHEHSEQTHEHFKQTHEHFKQTRDH